MMKQIITAVLAYTFILTTLAQETLTYESTGIVKTPLGATVNISEIKEDWAPLLRRLEMPVPGADSYRRFLNAVKKKSARRFPRRKVQESNKQKDTPQPILLRNFEANNMITGVPNDNDMAISNDGKVISVINSNIYIFDVEEDMLLKNLSLFAFASSLGLSAGKYDPKVIYDPKQDKFIMIFLNGFIDSTSNIVVGFSKTNDPTGNWNVYAITGDPRSDKVWSDYPMVAITDDELFITVNEIRNDSSWQGGFVQSLIWQVNKASGYNGDSLVTNLYSDVLFGGNPVRNLCPIQGGSTTTGPNIYLLSNKNFDIKNDTIFIIEVSGTLDDPETKIQVNMKNAETEYGVPPEARQKFNLTLATNDGRILGGFLEDDKIQFVGNSIDTTTGNAAVYHGMIKNVSGNNPIVTGSIIGHPDLDFGYPNISYTGLSKDDNQSIITFNYTGPDTFAGFAAVFYSDEGEYSEIKAVKEGETLVSVLGVGERWGDYSGSQPKYNQPGTIWTVGSLGIKKPGHPFGLVNTHGTWIAELSSPDSIPPVSFSVPRVLNITPYPNPAYDRFNIKLDIPIDTKLEITVHDIKGSLVKTLLKQDITAGRYDFSFVTTPLNQYGGVYFVTVREGDQISLSKKIVLFNMK